MWAILFSNRLFYKDYFFNSCNICGNKMNNDDNFYERRFLSNGQRMLDNFYSKRRSVDETIRDEDTFAKRNKQRTLKNKLSAEYVRLLKENNYLRDFIKKYKIKIKGERVQSVLDHLTTKNNKSTLSYHMDELHSKVSKTFIYY